MFDIPEDDENHICIFMNKAVKNLVGLHSMIDRVKFAVFYCTYYRLC